ncbi:protein kinase rio1 [Puttea exsequens]|nr:protein kinase rio1 [Puttea exsequens]
MADGASPAEGHAPPFVFVPGRGYLQNEAGTQESVIDGVSKAQEPQSEEEEEDFDDILEGDDFDTYDLESHNTSDFTKLYNKQRRLQEVSTDPHASKSSFPKANPQKPTANTLSYVDDQVSSLSRHAGKLQLDDRQAGFETKNSKGHEKSDGATNEQVLDPRTRMILLQMIN